MKGQDHYSRPSENHCHADSQFAGDSSLRPFKHCSVKHKPELHVAKPSLCRPLTSILVELARAKLAVRGAEHWPHQSRLPPRSALEPASSSIAEALSSLPRFELRSEEEGHLQDCIDLARAARGRGRAKALEEVETDLRGLGKLLAHGQCFVPTPTATLRRQLCRRLRSVPKGEEGACLPRRHSSGARKWAWRFSPEGAPRPAQVASVLPLSSACFALTVCPESSLEASSPICVNLFCKLPTLRWRRAEGSDPSATVAQPDNYLIIRHVFKCSAGQAAQVLHHHQFLV